MDSSQLPYTERQHVAFSNANEGIHYLLIETLFTRYNFMDKYSVITVLFIWVPMTYTHTT